MGTVVADRYLVDKIIGVGGMAVVFRGQHLMLKRDVAIKVLRPEYGENEEIAARFDREARAASGFDHPNCRQVFDCGVTKNGLKFMAMQLLKGRELAKVIGQPLPPSQCIHLAVQILRGLDHAHQRGVIHRDLKPDNIFVTTDHKGHEILKIVDFGIAKIVDEHLVDGLTTKVGAIVGTPAYMSPEQALGEEIDGRADLYAVGIILYELLTGAPPFRSKDSRKLMKAHIGGRIPPLPPTTPTLVTAGLSKLLARDRKNRYGNAPDAITALNRIASSLKSDGTPWVNLLEVPPRKPPPQEPLKGGTQPAGPPPVAAAGPDSKLEAIDGALKDFLAQHTPVAEEALRSGIRTPLSDFDE